VVLTISFLLRAIALAANVKRQTSLVAEQLLSLAQRMTVRPGQQRCRRLTLRFAGSTSAFSLA
jgi:hypothetical protein